MRLIVLFNLKPGVSPEAYEAWARSVDLPTVNALRSVERFAVFRTTGQLGSDAPPPYAYIETIDVADMDRFGADIATDAMKTIAAAFQAKADITFLTTEEIVA